MKSVFGFDVQIADPISIPNEIEPSPRKRYFAADLISTLPKKLTMGVTSVDICQATKHPIYGKVADWGIIGAAELSGLGGIVSTHRIKKRKWLSKITAHEVGHLLGYNHCETPTCSMLDIRGQGSKYEAINLGEFCDKH